MSANTGAVQLSLYQAAVLKYSRTSKDTSYNCIASNLKNDKTLVILYNNFVLYCMHLIIQCVQLEPKQEQ